MMNQFLILLKREYWEHRGSMLVLPLAITGFLIALIFLLSMLVASGNEHIIISGNDDAVLQWEDEHGFEREHGKSMTLTKEIMLEKLSELSYLPKSKQKRVVQKSLIGVATLMFFVMWGVIFFYLLSCLYEDRKDRSILFWKSMPVSDAMTLASKLVTAIWVIPAITIACIIILNLVMLLAATLLVIGEGIDIWQTFWVPADLFSLWFTFIVKMIYLSFWTLPFFGWLILVSASAKSNPLAWALGIPIAIVFLEKVSFTGNTIAVWFSHHLLNMKYMMTPTADWYDLSSSLVSLDMLSAVLVGAAAIAGAWWMRSRSEEL